MVTIEVTFLIGSEEESQGAVTRTCPGGTHYGCLSWVRPGAQGLGSVPAVISILRRDPVVVVDS